VKIKGMGVSVNSFSQIGILQNLDKILSQMENVGFDYAEIGVDFPPLVIGGKVRHDLLEKEKKVIRRHNLKYTLHGPDAMNLMSIEYFDRHKRAFEASMESAYEFGAEVLVYHAGIAPDELTDADTYSMLERREKETLYQFVDKAEKLGLIICIENTDGRRIMGRTNSRSGSELIPLVREINSKNFGIVYDFGHGYISSKTLGFDLIEDVKKCIPYIKHIHCHDNFGIIKQESSMGFFENYRDGLPLGFEDLHLPPGWGEIPFDKILRLFKEYENIIVLEIKEYFYDFLDEIYINTKKMLEEYLK